MEGADYEMCLKEAAEVNLGINVETPDTVLMFKEGGGPDMNAHTNQDTENDKEKLLQSIIDAM